jgi:hypothetical protein
LLVRLFAVSVLFLDRFAIGCRFRRRKADGIVFSGL